MLTNPIRVFLDNLTEAGMEELFRVLEEQGFEVKAKPATLGGCRFNPLPEPDLIPDEYTITLEWIGQSKAQVILALRKLYPTRSLGEVFEIVNQVPMMPAVIEELVDRRRASEVQNKLESLGAIISLTITGDEQEARS